MLTERSREIPFLLSRAVGARVMLDIGSAGSKYLAALSQVAQSLTAIDTHEFEVPYGVVGYIMDATALPTEWTGTFDCVSCISVLDHVGLDAYGNNADPEALGKVVSEMARITKKGGRLIVTAPVGRSQLTTHPNGGQRVFDRDEFISLFDDRLWLLGVREKWVLKGDEYVGALYSDIRHAEYMGNRAGACMGMELIRL